MMTGGEAAWVGRRPLKRIGGMSDALAIASDLGYSVTYPSQIAVTSQEEPRKPNAVTETDDLIVILRELSAVQRKIADLQVELHGREEDRKVAHLTHVSEMQKKIQTLSRITTILKDVIQNKDLIVARLQQPYSLDCIPVEAEYQKQFSELLLLAASDYGRLTASVADISWAQNFKEPPSVWGEMLRPIPMALASCTRFFKAITAMRESFATLERLKLDDSALDFATPSKDSLMSPKDIECVTPRNGAGTDELAVKSLERARRSLKADSVDVEDGSPGEEHTHPRSHRRLSWPLPSA